LETLGDLVKLQRGNTYDSRLLGAPGPVLLGLASIRPNGGFRDEALRTYGGDSPAKLLLHPGDLYVSLKDVTQSGDLLGAIARVPQSVPVGRLTQDTVALLPKSSDVPMDFIYWSLRTPQYRGYCRARAMGTTNLSLAREDFLSFEVGQVSTEKQWLVALLQALEDKIGHNRKTSAQVEELIHATYVSRWRTNDGSIALADVVECHRDPVDPRQVGPDTVYVGLEHMTPHSLSLERHGSAVDVGSGKAAFQPGDILFGRLRPYFHKVAVAHTVGIASQEILVLRPRSPELLGLAVCETSNPALIDHATAVSTGTRMPRASWADIGRFRFGYRGSTDEG
jgi:type I restriction enzyme S subunit